MFSFHILIILKIDFKSDIFPTKALERKHCAFKIAAYFACLLVSTEKWFVDEWIYPYFLYSYAKLSHLLTFWEK